MDAMSMAWVVMGGSFCLVLVLAIGLWLQWLHTHLADLRPMHSEQSLRPELEAVRRAAATQDGLGRRGVINALMKKRPLDVCGYHFAKDQPALNQDLVGSLQLYDLANPALERNGAFQHPWYRN